MPIQANSMLFLDILSLKVITNSFIEFILWANLCFPKDVKDDKYHVYSIFITVKSQVRTNTLASFVILRPLDIP